MNSNELVTDADLMNLKTYIVQIVQKRDLEIRSKLESQGVSAKILDDVFGQSGSSGFEPDSKPLPNRRLLGGKTKDSRRVVIDDSAVEISDSSQQYTPKDKYPQDYTKGEVVLVMNYTAKTHALFGDFKTAYVEFKDNVLKANPHLYSANSRLVFGFGWILKVKSKIDELRTSLKRYGIKYREVEFDVYLEEAKEAGESKKADVSVSDEEHSPSPPKKTKVKTEELPSKEAKPKVRTEKRPPSPPPPKKVKTKTKTGVRSPSPPKKVKASAKSKPKIAKNGWGNYEDDDGFVYCKLPIGKDGHKVAVVVGYQDPNPENDASGLETVLPLDEGLENECANFGHKILTEDMIAIVKKYDENLANDLVELRSRDDDDFDGDGDLEEDESDDEEDETSDDQ